MWPYLVGIEIRTPSHLLQLQELLAVLEPVPLLEGLWLVHSDFACEALFTAIRTLLPDDERFFVATLDERIMAHNLELAATP